MHVGVLLPPAGLVAVLPEHPPAQPLHLVGQHGPLVPQQHKLPLDLAAERPDVLLVEAPPAQPGRGEVHGLDLVRGQPVAGHPSVAS